MISVNCNLCGQDDWEIRYPVTTLSSNGRSPGVEAFRCTHSGYGQHPQIVQCHQCGLVYANPRWSEETLLAAYAAVEDKTYLQERSGRELTFRRHLAEMEKVVGPPDGRTLLDVGAYIGVFVDVATDSGWDALGVEPSSWASAEALQQGLPIINGTLAAPDLADRQFDVITMWDVIEHFADPAAEIDAARSLLIEDGWLVVHTMDVDSRLARLMGHRWPWLMDMHLTYFSRATMAEMMQSHGFEVVAEATQGRYLSLGYLASRVGGINRSLGRVARRTVEGAGLEQKAVGVNFGDLFTMIGRRVK